MLVKDFNPYMCIGHIRDKFLLGHKNIQCSCYTNLGVELEWVQIAIIDFGEAELAPDYSLLMVGKEKWWGSLF